MISVTYTIEIRHLIRGFDDYGFGTDKRMYNGGNMKSWLCSHFPVTTNADSQFFILRVIGCLFINRIINLKIQTNGKSRRT